MENKTARLTLLLDPRKQALPEEICTAKDVTPSQVVRQLMREYLIENLGDRPLPRRLQAAAKKNATRRWRAKIRASLRARSSWRRTTNPTSPGSSAI